MTKNKGKSPLELSNLEFSAPEKDDKDQTPPVDFGKVVPPEIFEWLAGDKEMPAEIRKLGDTINQKLNWFLVHSILAQYTRIPRMFAYMQKAEEVIYDMKDFEGDNVDRDTVRKNYSRLTSDLESLLEFSRKFTVQNKDIIGVETNPEDQVLLEKIKAMSPEMISKILKIVEDSKDEKL